MDITILHLSDIQYGRHHVDKKNGRQPLYPNEDYDVQLEKMIVDLDILKNQNVVPEFIAITGDITETGDLSEFELAENFMVGIANHLHIDRRRIMMVPGNHDINRKLCTSARFDADARGKPFNPPYFPKFEFYSIFFNRFYKDVKWPESSVPYEFSENKLFVNYYFPEQKIAFVGLNSCIDESDLEPHYGNITVEQLKKAVDELNEKLPDQEFIRVALMHHNFLRSPGNDDEHLKDADDLKPLFIKNGFHFIFHGHQHIPRNEITGKSNEVINILATGSSGLDSEMLPENCRRYQIIQIKDNQVKLYRRYYDGVESHVRGKGCWKPDVGPEQTNIFETFELSIPFAKKMEKGRPITPSSIIGDELYKAEAPEKNIPDVYGGDIDILKLIYPKKKIKIIDVVVDRRNRIFYNYLSIDIDLNMSLNYLFFKKHPNPKYDININATVKNFLEKHKLPSMGLIVLTPRIKRKQPGEDDPRDRDKNIKRVFESRMNGERCRIEIYFIDDYIWKNCLDLDIYDDWPKANEPEYFIDQNIYRKPTENGEVKENFSLRYFKQIFDTNFEDDNTPPITVILASGGMGKTTLCDKLVNLINTFDRKIGIYINSIDLVDKIETFDTDIKTIADLFRLYDSHNGNKYMHLHEPNNLEINISCGNIIVIIDGLDEIESALKNRFDLEQFLNSLVDLNNHFGNCKVILTSRDYHTMRYHKYQKRSEINLLYLKGFDENLVNLYYETRFSEKRLKKFSEEKLRKKALNYLNRLSLKSDDYYMPFFLNLIAEIVIREALPDIDDSDILYESSYLSLGRDNHMDNLLYRLIDREIKKQKLGITVDEFFELLIELAVHHRGHIKKDDFNNCIDVYFEKLSNNYGDSEDKYKIFYINPLLKVSEDSIQLKYDYLHDIIKVRYIQYSLKMKDYSKSLLSLFAEDNYGKGNLIEELVKKSEIEPSFFIKTNSEFVNYLIKEYDKKRNEGGQELYKYRKAISAVIYFTFTGLNAQSKSRSDRTEILKQLYNNELKYIFIYGDFFSLDFNNIQIQESIFVGYSQLSDSLFPADKTVFYNCFFKDMKKLVNKHVPESAFSHTCFIPNELKDIFARGANSRTKNFEIIKDDFKKFLKSFVTANAFSPKSINRINTIYTGKLSRSSFIKETISEGILQKKLKDNSGNEIYSIHKNFQTNVIDIITQNNLAPTLESFCKKILNKFYL